MAKPKTTYTSIAKAPTSFTKRVKNNISYNKISKSPTTFSRPTKSGTSYSPNGSPATSWLLNSTLVTLNSTIYLLSGYLGATPNQLNTKNATTFMAV